MFSAMSSYDLAKDIPVKGDVVGNDGTILAAGEKREIPGISDLSSFHCVAPTSSGPRN